MSNHDVAAGSLLCIGVVVAFCVVFALEARNIRRIEAAKQAAAARQAARTAAATETAGDREWRHRLARWAAEAGDLK
jgi:hypothetical protein